MASGRTHHAWLVLLVAANLIGRTATKLEAQMSRQRQLRQITRLAQSRADEMLHTAMALGKCVELEELKQQELRATRLADAHSTANLRADALAGTSASHAQDPAV